MNKKITMTILVATLFVTIGAFTVWAATGFHWYTKYQVVEIVEKEAPAEDDIFADTGLYEGETLTETVQKDSFHLGLLPTPQGLFDKHALSVGSLVGPAWLLSGVVLFIGWRKNRRKV